MVRKIHDYKLKLDLKDIGIARQLVINGTREDQLRYILKEEIEEGMTVVDVGANIGYYPIMEAKLVGESGFVYAIEPAQENFQLLLENIKLNGLQQNFETYNIGVSNKTRKERFYLSTHSNLHTFIKDGFDGKYTTTGVTNKYVDVDVTDLTAFLKNKRPVHLIRMDVEGYEVEILEGLENALIQGLFQGKIIFECHFPKYDNQKHSIKKQLEMLFKHGYKVKCITSNNEKVSKIRDFGYQAEKLIKTGDFVFQGVYRNISNSDAIHLVSQLGGVRDVVLVKE